jgi:PKD repeat protein
MKKFFSWVLFFCLFTIVSSSLVQAETTRLDSAAACEKPWAYRFDFEGQVKVIEHCGRNDNGSLNTDFIASRDGLVSIYYKTDIYTNVRLIVGGRSASSRVRGNDIWQTNLQVKAGERINLIADMGDTPFSGWTSPKGNVCNGFSGAANLDVSDLFSKIQADGRHLLAAQCWGDGYAHESFIKETYAKPNVNLTCTGSAKDCRDVTIEDMDFNDGAFFVAVAKVHESACEELAITAGNQGTVPAKMTFAAKASDSMGEISAYRFFFGDGKNLETSQSKIDHTYESSGNFYAYVQAKDSRGNWIDSRECRVTASVKSVPVETHKSGCSYLSITEGQQRQAPAVAKFAVAGFDNKGELKAYRIEFGDGQQAESVSTREFEHRYEKPGTYTVRASVQDSTGVWRSADTCRQTLYVNTKPLERQPETGTPTLFSVLALLGGLSAGAYPFIQGNKKLGKK